MIFDGMVSMVRERLQQILQADHVVALIIPIATAMVLAAAVSWVDFHTDEPTVLCGFVFLFCAACGAAFPLRRSSVCALVMAGCLPIYFIIGRLLGVRPHWPPAEIHSTNWADLVTVVPGVIGVLVGSGFRSVSAAVVSR